MTADPVPFLETLLKGRTSTRSSRSTRSTSRTTRTCAGDRARVQPHRSPTSGRRSSRSTPAPTRGELLRPGDLEDAARRGGVALWDAVKVLAETPSMSELKRSARAKLDFT
jgi:hypothetical protein